MTPSALIVGSGFTGSRVAALLLDRGWHVTVTTRTPARLAALHARGARVIRFNTEDEGPLDAIAERAHVLLSVPTLKRAGDLDEPTPQILANLNGEPRHLAYLSTTGVYGATGKVDETTPAMPISQRQQLRRAAEKAVLAMPCPTLVLRPAAIYGPNRGVHAAMRRGRFLLSGNRERFVSRIHVDDLAAISAAAMDQRLTGIFPVGDAHPAPSHQVAAFCAELMGTGMPAETADRGLSETRRTNRRVDGRAVLMRLGLKLRYPTYREGIPAAIAVETGS